MFSYITHTLHHLSQGSLPRPTHGPATMRTTPPPLRYRFTTDPLPPMRVMRMRVAVVPLSVSSRPIPPHRQSQADPPPCHLLQRSIPPRRAPPPQQPHPFRMLGTHQAPRCVLPAVRVAEDPINITINICTTSPQLVAEVAEREWTPSRQLPPMKVLLCPLWLHSPTPQLILTLPLLLQPLLRLAVAA